MIYRKAHITDCARHMGAVFPITLSISALIFLSRLLRETVANALPLYSLWQLLAFTIIKYIPQLLTVSLFAGIVLSIGRAFQRREMTVWFASGVGLRHFVMPSMWFAAPTILAIAVASCVISPWSVRAADALRTKLLSDVNPQDLRPGEFGITPGGDYTYYFGGDEDNPENIFLVRSKGALHEIIITRAASRQHKRDGEFLTLHDGVFYRMPRDKQLSGNNTPPEITAFDEMQIYLSSPVAAGTRPRGAPFGQLQWQQPAAQAEIIWRINQPLAALFFALLAPLVGSVFARVGQGRGMLLAILLFVIHLNLLYFARDNMGSGNMHFIIALLIAPAVAFVAALAVAGRRHLPYQ